MFETLFKYPHAPARHREAQPTERQRFAIYRANEGAAARNTLLRIATEILANPKIPMAGGPTVNDVLALARQSLMWRKASSVLNHTKDLPVWRHISGETT
jgi:hypothetical protein